MSRTRHRWGLDLARYEPAPGRALPRTGFAPTATDVTSLAPLMLSAYAGTIDDDGETLQDADAELLSYLSARPMLRHSVVSEDDGQPIGACLASALDDAGTALIAYVMTARDRKRSGIASALLDDVLADLKAAGYTSVLAVITEGNEASERLFRGSGFRLL